MTTTRQFDLVVVGSGPGGYVAAIRASQLGLKTAVVEKAKLGGVCLNWGCIPTKSLLKSADVFNEMKRAAEFGIHAESLSHDFSKVMSRSQQVAQKMSQGVQFLMKKNKIEVIKGHARLTSPHTVEVIGEQRTLLNTKSVLLATGARARPLPGIDIDEKSVITYKTAIRQQTQPKRLLVIGAGAIGVEFAYFYRSMGTEVTIVEYQDKLLPIEDQEVSKELMRQFKKQGIQIKTGSSVEGILKTASGLQVTVKSVANSELATLDVDQVLVAVGVQGNSEDIGLEPLSIQVEKSFVKVNERYETHVQGVYAIGDLIGPPLLAHVASAEAIRCVEWIAGYDTPQIDYGQIPGCTYAHPQVASIGLTEEAAKAKGIDVKVGKFPFSASGKASAIGDTAGFVKKIFDAQYNQLIGVHMVGPEVTELLTASSIALSHEATAQSILHTIHAHPTLGEAMMEATAVALDEVIHL